MHSRPMGSTASVGGMGDWDATGYDQNFTVITRYGDDLLTVLAARPGERVLDAGCGPGDHVAQLRADGVLADGVDASAAMVATARAKHPGLPFAQVDVRELPADQYDAVFSNAALHWVPEPDRAAAGLARALRIGGRLVLDMGGHRNIAAVRAAVATVRAGENLPPAAPTWYFPTLGEYAAVLESAGFEVTTAALFDRPTPVSDDDGMVRWLGMFGAGLLDGFTDPGRAAQEIAALLRPALFRDGTWWVDYRRLRVVAVRQP